MLVVVNFVLKIIIFQNENLKDFVMRLLNLLLHLIIKYSPTLNYNGIKTNVEFIKEYLKQDKGIFNQGTIVNIYTVYKLSANPNNYDFTSENCLFVSVSLTKNNDTDNYKYSGYGIGFDSKGRFLFPDGSFAQNLIIFRADMSSSVHVDNKKKQKKLYFNSLSRFYTVIT